MRHGVRCAVLTLGWVGAAGFNSGGIMPMVIGHRGLPALYPENTLPSFLAAMDAGADGIESDLRLTSDGVIMLMHDATLDRTTNCTGPISSYTQAQLASCNANYAAVFGNQFGFVPIPTFESIVTLTAQRGLTFVLDLKDPVMLGQYIRPVVERANATSLVIMSCWTWEQVADAVVHMNASARQMLNDTAWGLTGEAGAQSVSAMGQRALWSDLLVRGVRGFSMAATNVTPQFVQEAHARLLPVNVWTVDLPDDVNAFIDMGVDGILTNNVITVGAIVAQRAAQALHGGDDDGDDDGRAEVVAIGVGSALGGMMVGALIYHFAKLRQGRRNRATAGYAAVGTAYAVMGPSTAMEGP